MIRDIRCSGPSVTSAKLSVNVNNVGGLDIAGTFSDVLVTHRITDPRFWLAAAQKFIIIIIIVYLLRQFI